MSIKKSLYLVVALSLLYLAVSALPVEAQWSPGQPLVPCGGTGQDECTRCELFHLVRNLMDFGLLFVLPVVGTLLFVYAGVLYIISAGNSGVQSKARGIFTNTIYATLVICLAWVITNTVMVNVGDNVSGNWYSFACTPVAP